MDRREVFCDLIDSYAQAYMAFLTQSVACNALHSVDERLAGWLLTSHDRMGQDDFPLTQGSWRSCSGFVALWSRSPLVR
jgi:hypothetical protein